MTIFSSDQTISTRLNYSSGLEELLRPAIFDGRVKRHPSGEVVQLWKYESAVVLLMERQNPGAFHVLKQGKFVLNLILHSVSTMVMAACIVTSGEDDDDVRLPLTRQVPVFKVATRSFIIALPGLIYGLWFPAKFTHIYCSLLTKALSHFSGYEDFSGVAFDAGNPEDNPHFWLTARDRLLPILHNRLQDFGLITGLSPTALGNQASELLRSLRMSVAVDLIMKVMLSGIIQLTQCYFEDLRQPHPSGSYPLDNEESYPSISVFTDMIEAQEFSWLLATKQNHLVRPKNMPVERLPSGFKIWGLNQSGFRGVLRLLERDGRMPEQTNNQQVGRGSEGTGKGNISANPAAPNPDNDEFQSELS